LGAPSDESEGLGVEDVLALFEEGGPEEGMKVDEVAASISSKSIPFGRFTKRRHRCERWGQGDKVVRDWERTRAQL